MHRPEELPAAWVVAALASAVRVVTAAREASVEAVPGIAVREAFAVAAPWAAGPRNRGKVPRFRWKWELLPGVWLKMPGYLRPTVPVRLR